MRRVLQLLLMTWIILQSVLVQAHVVEESMHQLSHSIQVSDASVAGAEQGEPCSAMMCTHPVGAFFDELQTSGCPRSVTVKPPVLRLKFSSVPADIERPKWSPATLGVASI